MNELRSKVIRLAHANPEMRPKLLPVLMPRIAVDVNDPKSLLLQLESLFQAAGIVPDRDFNRFRDIILQQWNNRSTEVSWDWKPAARHIRDWLENTLSMSPSNVWMSKNPGGNIALKFQMPDWKYSQRWNNQKFKTLRGQLSRKFGMTPSGSDESLYTLPDGSKVEVSVFVGGTPGSDKLG